MVPGADAHCPLKILMSLENVFGFFTEIPAALPAENFCAVVRFPSRRKTTVRNHTPAMPRRKQKMR